VPETGQQHGGGRSGDPCAHDDHIVTAAVRGLHGHLPPCWDHTRTHLALSVDRSNEVIVALQ
jgi:hypothetical protein